MAKEKTEETPKEDARAFNPFFAKLSDGDAHREASGELHGLLAKLQQLNRMSQGPKRGKITITLHVTVDSDMVDIGYDVTTKEPKPPRKADRAWLSRGGNIVYEDPRQMSLQGVRGLPAQKEARDFDDETGESKEAP